MSEGDGAGRFQRQFERWARRVRVRLGARRALAGLAVGLALGALAAAALWWLRHAEWRPWAAALGAAGALGGLAVARRKRWSDPDIALFLDARLAKDELISTAVELGARSEASDPARAVVVERAAEALENADPRGARPRILGWMHLLGPAGAGLLVWVSLIAPRAVPPAPPAAPGQEIVKLAELAGLEKIEALDELDARDAAQKQRLKEIADEARKLRQDLARGTEKREAQARIAKLRDDIAAERSSFGDKENRAGLDAAVGKLQGSRLTRDAARALGDGDLAEFDREMQRLANLREKKDRDAARQALEEAEKAARERGARQLAESLSAERDAFEKRAARAEALRELARELEGKLDDRTRKDLEELGDTGSPQAGERLAEALGEALEGLSDEEKKRLAERLRERLEQQGGAASPESKQRLEELAKKLESPQGREELRRQLKELARQDPSGDSKRQQGLDDADRGGAQCQGGLGAPTPAPGQGQQGNQAGRRPGDGRRGGKRPGGGDARDGQGGPGSHKDTGTGSHEGHTDPVEAPGLRAKARGELLPGMPMHGATLGRAPSRAGGTANQRGQGALGAVGPEEVGGVERSDVPEEYREHVGRYFQP